MARQRWWGKLSLEDTAKRDAHILELWAMGQTRDEIAEQVDLTPQRVSQIVNGFGCGWRPNRYQAGRR